MSLTSEPTPNVQTKSRIQRFVDFWKDGRGRRIRNLVYESAFTISSLLLIWELNALGKSNRWAPSTKEWPVDVLAIVLALFGYFWAHFIALNHDPAVPGPVPKKAETEARHRRLRLRAYLSLRLRKGIWIILALILAFFPYIWLQGATSFRTPIDEYSYAEYKDNLPFNIHFDVVEDFGAERKTQHFAEALIPMRMTENLKSWENALPLNDQGFWEYVFLNDFGRVHSIFKNLSSEEYRQVHSISLRMVTLYLLLVFLGAAVYGLLIPKGSEVLGLPDGP